MLLFEADLAQQNRLDAWFLRAQAMFGLGDTGQAETLLRKLLEADDNHVESADLLSQIENRTAPSDSLRR
jgi:Tfp pilus assembly protein FimV